MPDIAPRRRAIDLAFDVFAAMPEALMIVAASANPGGSRILHVNPAFEALTGWSAAALHGRRLSMLDGARTRRAVLADRNASLWLGESWSGVIDLRGADGALAPYDVRLSPLTARGRIAARRHGLFVARPASSEAIPARDGRGRPALRLVPDASAGSPQAVTR